MGGARDDVNQWLSGLEAQVAEGGWGQDHVLWVGSVKDMGKDSNGDGVLVVDFRSVFEFEIEEYSGPDDLFQFAQELRASSEMRSLLLNPGGSETIFAVAFSGEMWSVPPQDSQQWRGRFAEHPNREELRGITAVDRAGNKYAIMRLRSRDRAEILVGVAGAAPRALRQILAALSVR